MLVLGYVGMLASEICPAHFTFLSFVQVLLEKERERKALLEDLLQAQGELTGAYQQLEQLQQKVQEQQGKEQVGVSNRKEWRRKNQLITWHKMTQKDKDERRDEGDRDSGEQCKTAELQEKYWKRLGEEGRGRWL